MLQVKLVKAAMAAALKQARSLNLGFQSVLDSRLAVCLPAVADACADIVAASLHASLKHEACSLLGCGLHALPQVWLPMSLSRPCTKSKVLSCPETLGMQVLHDRLRAAAQSQLQLAGS